MMPYGTGNQSVQAAPRKTASFCQYCGGKLDAGARFCKHCGEPVSHNVSQQGIAQPSSALETNPTERRIVYEGNIHKCPNCGEIIDAFVTVCPTCGHEIREAKSSVSVRELALKLERISAQKMPVYEEKKSVMKKIFGRDLNEDDEAEEAVKRFESQRDREKASLIVNFSVPNTKEDIMEFMLLATSNIDTSKSVEDEVTKAWIAKMDQVYQRAKISLRGQPELDQITNIYQRKKKELGWKYLSYPLFFVGCFALMFFFAGIAANPVATVCITVGILAVGIALYVIYKKKKKNTKGA